MTRGATCRGKKLKLKLSNETRATLNGHHQLSEVDCLSLPVLRLRNLGFIKRSESLHTFHIKIRKTGNP